MTDPIHPTPVLSYGTGIQAEDSWLAKLVCGVCIMNGAIDVGFTAVKSMSNGPSRIDAKWPDLPIAICGLALMVFAAMGLFRVRRSRFAIGFLSGISILLNWMVLGLFVVTIGRVTTSSEWSMIAYESVYALQSAIAPVFVIICMWHPSVRGFFERRNRV